MVSLPLLELAIDGRVSRNARLPVVTGGLFNNGASSGVSPTFVVEGPNQEQMPHVEEVSLIPYN